MDTRKLRQKLLDLAIHGKLVPQDPNDEPASELLSRIHAEKLAMVARGELKPKDVKNDTVIYFGSDGLPYEKRTDGKGETKRIENSPLFVLPEGWVWARLGSLSAQINYGVSNSAERSGSHKLLRITDIDQQKVDWNCVPYTTVDEATATNCRVNDGDILFARIGATVGKTYLATGTPRNTVYASYLIRVQALLCDAHYLINFFDTPYYWEEISSNAVGSGRPNVNGTVLSGLFVPVPPLAEQRRIVDALGKYLALVDRIERDRADLDGLLAQLKSKVLDLAVRGELTERDPGDEPASELLARIREEKLAMVARGELKPKDVKNDTVIFTGSDGLHYEKRADGKGEAECIEGEIPFKIPEGWSWARLGQLVTTCGGKTPSKANEAFWEGGGVSWITSKDMKAPELFGSQIELTESGAAETNMVPAGSVLMVVRSGILRRLLPVAINRVETTINQDLKAMTPYDLGFSDWLLTCFNAWDKRIRNKYHKDGTTVDSIEFDAMLSMLLPIPSLAEQRRIVKAIKTAFDLTSL